MPFLRQVSNFVFLICLMFFTGCSAYVDDDDSATEPDASDTSNPITWTDCGGKVGDRPCDFTFVDQNGDEWNLYDNYGQVILLDFSTMWCSYCQISAMDVQNVQDQIPNRTIRGILVAPSISLPALKQLEADGLEFREISAIPSFTTEAQQGLSLIHI